MKNGEAFGNPGLAPNWTSSAKQGIGTSLSAASPVWFTLGHGILNELYFPSVDTANTPSACSLIPEQVWDTEDIPEKHMLIGRPTGSALPLVWSHAEYIKLLRSEHDAAVFDLIAPVRKRYIDGGITTGIQVWTFKQKLRELEPEYPLRIEVYAPGSMRWSADNWITVHDTELADAGLDVYVHAFERGQFTHAVALKFTFYWNNVKRWEGQDFSVRVE
jgi:glucoamylase